MLTFQSVVDATVSTSAVVQAMFDQFEANGSELVLFDINRLSGMEPFIDPVTAAVLSRLTDLSPRRYGRALVTNADRESLEVVERSIRRWPDGNPHAAARPRLAAGDVLALAHRLAVPA